MTEWSNFEQEYLYDAPIFLTYHLISQNYVSLSRNVKDTKEIMYKDFNNFINEYNPCVFKKDYLKFQ